MKLRARRQRSWGYGGDRPWVLENDRGQRLPDVAAQWTYSDLLAAAASAGYSIRDIELLSPRRPHGAELRRQLEEAIWAGDVERLHELAPCGCCCWEHTHEGCSARMWNGCRGSGQLTRADTESWARHYAEHHGMTRAEFFGEVM